MDLQASIEQVAGILHREGLHFDIHADGDSYRLLFDREAVFVHFDRWGAERVRVWLSAPALQGIDPESVAAARVLNALGELNRRHRFVKWLFDGGTLLAVHDLLGDHLQAPELLNAVYALASAAAEAADELCDEDCGLRYDEVLQAAQDDDDV